MSYWPCLPLRRDSDMSPPDRVSCAYATSMANTPLVQISTLWPPYVFLLPATPRLFARPGERGIARVARIARVGVLPPFAVLARQSGAWPPIPLCFGLGKNRTFFGKGVRKLFARSLPVLQEGCEVGLLCVSSGRRRPRPRGALLTAGARLLRVWCCRIGRRRCESAGSRLYHENECHDKRK